MARIHRTVQKILNELDNQDGVVTHPEPDILECEVKWALGSTAANKASGGDRIPAKLFKILEDETINFSTQYVKNLEKPAVTRGLENVNPHPNSQEGQY